MSPPKVMSVVFAS